MTNMNVSCWKLTVKFGVVWQLTALDLWVTPWWPTRAENHVRCFGAPSGLLWVMTIKWIPWSVGDSVFSNLIWLNNAFQNPAAPQFIIATRERQRFSDQRLLPLESPSATRYLWTTEMLSRTKWCVSLLIYPRFLLSEAKWWKKRIPMGSRKPW